MVRGFYILPARPLEGKGYLCIRMAENENFFAPALEGRRKERELAGIAQQGGILIGTAQKRQRHGCGRLDERKFI